MDPEQDMLLNLLLKLAGMGQRKGQDAGNAMAAGQTASYRGPARMASPPPYPLSDPLMGGQAGGYGPSRGANSIEDLLRQLQRMQPGNNGVNR